MSNRIIKNVSNQNLSEPHIYVTNLLKKEFGFVANTHFDIEDLGGGGHYYMFRGFRVDRTEGEIFVLLERDNPNNILTKLLVRYGFNVIYNGMQKVYQIELNELGIRTGHFTDLAEAIRRFRFRFFLMLESMSNNLSQAS